MTYIEEPVPDTPTTSTVTYTCKCGFVTNDPDELNAHAEQCSAHDPDHPEFVPDEPTSP